MSKTAIRATGLTKRFRSGRNQIEVLEGVEFDAALGDLTMVMGPSGSGKSTLMNVIGCLDQPSAGSYALDGIETSQLSDDQLAEVRNKRIGFVFQMFNLLARVPALEQVQLPLLYAGAKNKRELATAALEAVGLGSRLHHKPSEMSGGQQQRVAIARSLVTDPAIILADEPTGNLDTRSTEEILALFQKLNQEQGITIVLVTHEPEVGAHASRIIHIRDGRVHQDQPVAQPVQATAILARLPVEEDA
jgi:putative ABC transport system ATP-binding protein